MDEIQLPTFASTSVSVTVQADDNQTDVEDDMGEGMMRFVWIAVENEQKGPLGAGTIYARNVALALPEAFRQLARIQENNFKEFVENYQKQKTREKLAIPNGNVPPIQLHKR